MLFRTTPQERQALGITALLLLAGIGVRLAAAPSGAVEWAVEGADTLVAEGLAGTRAAAAAELERERMRSKPLAPGEQIDPNAADELQLDRLPRVGPALARRIVEWREAEGPFRDLDDLNAVPGIGPSLIEALAPLVTLRSAPQAPPQPARAPVGLAREPAAARPAQRIDINRADPATLETLPGIGPALAARIVASRNEAGPFGSVDELERVSGVGPVLLRRLTPLIEARR